MLELTSRVHATGQMQSKVQGLNYSYKFGLQIRVKYRQEIQGWPGAKCVSPILAGGTSSVRQTGDVTASHLSMPWEPLATEYGFSAEIEKYSRKIQKNSAQRCSAMFNVNLRDPCPKSNGLDWELK